VVEIEHVSKFTIILGEKVRERIITPEHNSKILRKSATGSLQVRLMLWIMIYELRDNFSKQILSRRQIVPKLSNMA
jgi:hypothetical protein